MKKLLNYLAALAMFVLYINYRLAFVLVFTRPTYEMKDWERMRSKEMARIVLFFDLIILSSYLFGLLWTVLGAAGLIGLNYLIFFTWVTYKRLRK